MNIVKNRALLIVLILGINSLPAKQMNKSTSPGQQQVPIRPVQQPIIQNQPYIQPQRGELTYGQILSALKQNAPDSSDFAALNNIKNEVDRQLNMIQTEQKQNQPIGPIKDIQSKYSFSKTTRMKNDAEILTKKYKIPFQINVANLTLAQKSGDEDIFTAHQSEQQEGAIRNIVIDFKKLHPDVDKQTGMDILLFQINSDKDLYNLRGKISTRKDEELNNEIKDIVSNAWDMD